MLRCVNPVCLPELSLDELIEVAGRWGYDAVEFPAQSACSLGEMGALDELQIRCHELGVNPYACSGALALDDMRPADLMCEPEVYKTAKRGMERRLAAAWELGAKLAIVTMGPHCLPGTREAACDEACERLATVSGAAGRCGLKVAVEFTGVQLASPPRLYNSIGEFLDLTAKVDLQLGIVFDTWHWFNSGWNRSDVVRLCARTIPLIHLNDAHKGARPPLPDQARLLPGKGALGIFRIMDLLPTEAVVSIEVFDDGLRALSPDEACRKLDRAWGQILI